MIRKKHKLIILLLSLFAFTEKCFAATARFESDFSFEQSTPSSPKDNFVSWSNYDSGKSRYQYRYEKVMYYDRSISVNAYNMNGESVMPTRFEIDATKYKFKAGTWVGVNVMEDRSVEWKVNNFQYQKIMRAWNCTYGSNEGWYINGTRVLNTNKSNCEALCAAERNGQGCKEMSFSGGTCSYRQYVFKYKNHWKTTSEKYTEYHDTNSPCAPTYYDGINYKLISSEPISTEQIVSGAPPSDTQNSIKQNVVNQTYQEAKSYVMATATGEVKYITNHKYPENIADLEYGTVKNASGASGNPDIDRRVKDGPDEYSGIVKKSHEILQPKVCINLKTSQVTYGRDCETDEKKIENAEIYDTNLGKTVKYWHYFIPLNTTSDTIFSLNVVKDPTNSTGKFTEEECENYMRNHLDTYSQMIIPNVDEKKFVGDYNPHATNKSVSTDYTLLDQGDGCFISATVIFPIEQKFYNEITATSGTKKIKGFNFYYRPIDINDPFPNSIEKDSLWYREGLTTETTDTKIKKSIDYWKAALSSSYDEITYTATNINSNNVRTYTKTHPYTSWNNMNINGTSQYIGGTDGSIIKRINSGSVYKLGCGPANEQEHLDAAKTIKNPLYVSGCDTP